LDKGEFTNSAEKNVSITKTRDNESLDEILAEYALTRSLQVFSFIEQRSTNVKQKIAISIKQIDKKIFTVQDLL